MHVASWRAAYAGLLPADFLAGLDVTARAERWREILSANGPGRTLLAEVGQQVVGFVSVGPPLDDPPLDDPPLDDPRPDTGWLYALYVDPAHWDTGAGHLLHEAGLDLLRSDGCVRAELWVLRGNTRAITFYERHGWSQDGRQQLDRHVPGVDLDEIGLSRPLSRPSP